MTNTIHIPVLLKEALSNLDIQPNDTIADFTVGFGGHASHIIEKLNQDGRYIGIDQDITAVNHCKQKFKSMKNVSIYHSNYHSFDNIFQKENIKKIDKVLIDLGVSSKQFDDFSRGFSHREDATLDMRMDQSCNLTAKDILNTYSKHELSDIFYNYGELIHNKKLVENIVYHRKKHTINTTFELCELIKKSYYFNNNRKNQIKIYSQVFQALRIEVNKEFEVLQNTLTKLYSYLKETSVVFVITFHSLEDKLVKTLVKSSSTYYFSPKKVIKPSYEEKKKNSRARSAHGRVIRVKSHTQ